MNSSCHRALAKMAVGICTHSWQLAKTAVTFELKSCVLLQQVQHRKKRGSDAPCPIKYADPAPNVIRSGIDRIFTALDSYLYIAHGKWVGVVAHRDLGTSGHISQKA